MTLQTTRPRPAPPPAATRGTVEPRERAPDSRRKRHWAWLAAGFPFAFSVPFLLADQLDLNRDLFYGLYALAVAGFVAAWARDTRLTSRDFTRNWRWGLVLGAAAAVLLAFIVLRARSTRPLAREASGSPPRSSGAGCCTASPTACCSPSSRFSPSSRPSPAPASTAGRRQGADRDDRDGRLDRDHSLVPHGVLRFPVGEGAEADRG